MLSKAYVKYLKVDVEGKKKPHISSHFMYQNRSESVNSFRSAAPKVEICGEAVNKVHDLLVSVYFS